MNPARITPAPVATFGNGLYSASEWATAFRLAEIDGYMGEIEAMLERDAAFVPADPALGPQPYAETDESAFIALFPDYPRAAESYVPAALPVGRG